MWNWPFWKFPVGALGVLCWAVLTWSNIMTVESIGSTDVWGGRFLMALMGWLDVVGLFTMAGLAWMLRRRSALGVLGWVFLGGVCLLAEGAGARHYLLQVTASTEAPSKDAEARRADIQADIDREEKTLESTRAAKLKAASKGRDTDELTKSERASLAAIENLRRSMPRADATRVFARFAGYETYAAMLLLTISQVAFAVVQVRGEDEPAHRPEIMSDPALAEILRELKTPSRPLVEISQPTATSQPTSLLLSQPVDVQLIGEINKPAGCDQNPTKNQPRLKLVERHQSLDDFQTTVRDLVSAGFSEREIQEKTGRTRHQVRQAKSAITKLTTNGRA